MCGSESVYWKKTHQYSLSSPTKCQVPKITLKHHTRKSANQIK